jgi:hypothetical protein
MWGTVLNVGKEFNYFLPFLYMSQRCLLWHPSVVRFEQAVLCPANTVSCTKWSCQTLFEMEDTAVSVLIIMLSPMFQISKPNPPTLSRPDEF